MYRVGAYLAQDSNKLRSLHQPREMQTHKNGSPYKFSSTCSDLGIVVHTYVKTLRGRTYA